MRHSIFSVILLGILFGATFFFMPQLVLGIFILFVIIRLLHVAFMGHRWYGHGYYGHAYGHGHGYGPGCDCGYGSDQGYESDCNCGPGHYQNHHHGHGPMKGHMFHWADKIRNMSEEEFTEFKDNMDKGFGFSFRGSKYGSDKKYNNQAKNEAPTDSDSNEKKEETTKL